MIELYIFLYKITSLLVGMLTIYLGYLLFVRGINVAAGDMVASGNGNVADGGAGQTSFHLSLNNAAPGTFFAFFGMLVIGFTIFQGFEYTIAYDDLDKGETVDIVIPDPESLASG